MVSLLAATESEVKINVNLREGLVPTLPKKSSCQFDTKQARFLAGFPAGFESKKNKNDRVVIILLVHWYLLIIFKITKISFGSENYVIGILKVVKSTLKIIVHNTIVKNHTRNRMRNHMI